MENEKISELKAFLAKQYADLFKCPSLEKKAQMFAIIIDTKVESNNLDVQNAKNSLYLDVKCFLSVYLRNKRRKILVMRIIIGNFCWNMFCLPI